MRRFRTGVLALLFCLALPGGAGAVDVSVQVVLSVEQSFERNIVRYECEGVEPFLVDYINAQPNFLAILPIEGQSVIFVSTVSDSGVRYVSGSHEWWTRRTDATLADLSAVKGTAPLACSEFAETP